MAPHVFSQAFILPKTHDATIHRFSQWCPTPPPAATADQGSRERHMASDAAASEYAVQQLQLSRSSLGKWAVKID